MTAITPAAARSNDLLQAMRPAMDQAAAVGRPSNPREAASVLATGGAYLQGAQSTIARLDAGIEQRRAALEASGGVDTPQLRQQREQLDMLQRLRDRIQLSVERVSDILAGRDRDDIGSGDDEPALRRMRDRREQQPQIDQLEQRRQLLAERQVQPAQAVPMGVVVGAYGAGASAG